MKAIILYNKKGIVLVDDENYDQLKKITWHLHSAGYARTNFKINDKWTSIYMHRMIMDTPLKLDTDHIDGNKLNNLKSNLRVATHSQNLCNRKITKDLTSQFKGVCWHKHNNKWHARIMLNYKYKHLGFFTDETEAAQAYNDMAVEIFGEFALINNLEKNQFE